MTTTQNTQTQPGTLTKGEIDGLDNQRLEAECGKRLDFPPRGWNFIRDSAACLFLLNRAAGNFGGVNIEADMDRWAGDNYKITVPGFATAYGEFRFALCRAYLYAANGITDEGVTQ